MDTEPTRQVDLPPQPAATYSAPPGVPPPAWQSTPAPRRPRRLPWRTLAIAAAFLIAIGGMGLLALDDSNRQTAINSLTTQNESLTGQNQILTDQLKQTQSNLTATLGELTDTKAALAHPHLTIWNVPQHLAGPAWSLVGGIPDTFTYHLVATSTGPMSVSILTFDQYAAGVQCVRDGYGPTNYCMHHSVAGVVMTWASVTSVNYDFHLSEGCADYLSVFTAATAVTVTPNVSVTYNPASSSTGTCA